MWHIVVIVIIIIVKCLLKRYSFKVLKWRVNDAVLEICCSNQLKPWFQLRFEYDTNTMRLRSDYDVSRTPAYIRRDSTRAKNEHVNFSP